MVDACAVELDDAREWDGDDGARDAPHAPPEHKGDEDTHRIQVHRPPKHLGVEEEEEEEEEEDDDDDDCEEDDDVKE